jgi:hypothetical protein
VAARDRGDLPDDGQARLGGVERGADASECLLRAVDDLMPRDAQDAQAGGFELRGALISGRRIPPWSRKSSRRSSSSVRVGAGPSAMAARSLAAPRWPFERSSSSWIWRSETAPWAWALRVIARSALAGRIAARSSSVRAGEVTRRSLRHSASRWSSAREQCTRTPSIVRVPQPLIVTSMTRSSQTQNPTRRPPRSD